MLNMVCSRFNKDYSVLLKNSQNFFLISTFFIESLDMKLMKLYETFHQLPPQRNTLSSTWWAFWYTLFTPLSLSLLCPISKSIKHQNPSLSILFSTQEYKNVNPFTQRFSEKIHFLCISGKSFKRYNFEMNCVKNKISERYFNILTR